MPSNELSRAASPYLQQHAHNPVHWRMWTPAVLEEARETGKPILLSVGYAACHWCHVMAHESFEDPATAAVMNELFVNVKVDREERPDIDHIYMTSLQALGLQGGWPLTMFLTPDGEAFWGGTYFPKVAQYGRPDFVTVLKSVAETFRAEPDKIAHNAAAIRSRLLQSARAAPGARGAGLDLGLLDDLAPRVAGLIDQTNGGLRGAPKFPNAPIFEFLWRAGTRLQDSLYIDLVKLTLARMSEGGLFDHLGGGYARYSTDEKWLVPHFEKMLYDNAQILELLALCYADSKDDLFRTRATETVAWLRREMTHAQGAFCASLDADSEGEEGKFYTWTFEELAQILGKEDALFFADFYDASDAGNWVNDHGQAVTILNRLGAERPSPEQEARLAPLRRKLFEAREARVHPGLDDKIMADWNGLMIAALANAAPIFNEPEWIGLAARAYEFIVGAMQYADARLAHSWRAGVLVRPGMALDYAAMIRAALALHESRNWAGRRERDYLADAIGWAQALETYHRDGETGLLRMAAEDAADIVVRLAPTSDDAIPNAHPAYLSALVRLAAQSEDERWLARADELFEAVRPAVEANVLAHAGILNAFDFRLRAKEIVTAGPARRELYETALGAPFTGRIVIDIDNHEGLAAGSPRRAQAQSAGDAAAFVCASGVCSAPARNKQELLERIEQFGRPSP
jgi:uncharacterized protein